MRSAEVAFRAALVALAGTLAALIAHWVIDEAGDYLLAHDAYDGVSHHSRGIILLAVTLVVVAGIVRVAFDVLDRRHLSAVSLLRSVRRSIGPAASFVVQTAVVAIVLTAAMESLDLALAHVAIDDVADLFGGSLTLGLGCTLGIGVCLGALIHRLVQIISDFEPQIAALLVRLIATRTADSAALRAILRPIAFESVERALLLSRRGTKRGPPFRLLDKPLF